MSGTFKSCWNFSQIRSEGLTVDFRWSCFEFLCSDNEVLCCCLASVECRKRKRGLTSTENLATDGKGKDQEGIQSLKCLSSVRYADGLNDRLVEKRNCWGRARRWKSDDWEPRGLSWGGSFDFSSFIAFYVKHCPHLFMLSSSRDHGTVFAKTPHSAIRMPEDSCRIPRQMSPVLIPCKSNDDYWVSGTDQSPAPYL